MIEIDLQSLYALVPSSLTLKMDWMELELDGRKVPELCLKMMRGSGKDGHWILHMDRLCDLHSMPFLQDYLEAAVRGMVKHFISPP